MKFSKILIVVFMLGIVGACDNTEMDLMVNPNVPTADKANLNDLYNSIQLNFAGNFIGLENTPGAAVRMYNAGSFSYVAFAGAGTWNGLWFGAYSQLYPDIDALIALSEGKGFDIHTGSAKIMKAITMMYMVDILGDVPHLEAGQGTEIISPAPTTDGGQSIYNAAIALLDEAIGELTGTVAGAPAFDGFYGGDPAGWITLANTWKLRAALNTGDVGTVNSLVGAGDLIDDPSEDFQFSAGNNRNNPNSRHPFYNQHYEAGDGPYLSNYYMWMLRSAKRDLTTDATIIDPRVRYYFYRKIDDAFNQDGTTYSCHFTALPTDDPGAQIAHYNAVDPNLPYCVLEDGYSGRDHLNGGGIPPDGPTRTSYGLYPGGGEFDESAFIDTHGNGSRGGLGQGIAPIMLSSFVDFMRAEAVLSLGASGDARALLGSGIRKSLDKVEGFESLVSAQMSVELELRDGSTGTVKDLFGMSEQDKDDYIDAVYSYYDAATTNEERLDVVIREYYIAAFGNGIEAYNMYRRTGYPGNMQPGLEPTTGTAADPFPRSFLLPNVHVERNSNSAQKPDGLSTPVFWDPGKTLY